MASSGSFDPHAVTLPGLPGADPPRSAASHQFGVLDGGRPSSEAGTLGFDRSTSSLRYGGDAGSFDASLSPPGAASRTFRRKRHAKDRKRSQRVTVHIVDGPQFSINVGRARQNLKWLGLAAAQRLKLVSGCGASSPACPLLQTLSVNRTAKGAQLCSMGASPLMVMPRADAEDVGRDARLQDRFYRVLRASKDRHGRDFGCECILLCKVEELYVAHLLGAGVRLIPRQLDETPLTPTDQIDEVLRGRTDLYITLMRERTLDARGGVKVTDFATDAFQLRNATANQRRYERHRKEGFGAKMKALKRSCLEMGAQHHVGGLMDSPLGMDELMLFEEDWIKMRVPKDMIDDLDVRSTIHDRMRDAYHELRVVFKQYCNSPGEDLDAAFTMSRSEFKTMVHDTRLNKDVVRPMRLAKIFQAAAFGVDKSAALAARPVHGGERLAEELSRVQFLDAILLLAAFWDQARRPTMPVTSATPPLTDLALRLMLNKYILPRVRHMSGAGIRAQLSSHGVAVQLVRDMEVLRRAFTDHCGIQSRHVRGRTLTMTLERFLAFLYAVGLVTPPGRRDTVSDVVAIPRDAFTAVPSAAATDEELIPEAVFVPGMHDGRQLHNKEVEECFILSQAEDEDNSPDHDGDGIPDTSTLVFSEFIEALARVAALRWDKFDELDLQDKIALAIDCIVVYYHFRDDKEGPMEWSKKRYAAMRKKLNRPASRAAATPPLHRSLRGGAGGAAASAGNISGIAPPATPTEGAKADAAYPETDARAGGPSSAASTVGAP